MSAVSAVIAVMRAKGIDPADILDVVEAIATAEPCAPARSAGAERQARYRQRRGVTSDVTSDVTPPALNDPVPNLETLEVSLNPPPYSPPAAKNSRGTRLSPDAAMSERNLADAKRHGVPDDRLAAIWERYRNFWVAKSGKDAVKLNWDATWCNWCSSEAERRGWAVSSPSPATGPTPAGIRISPIDDPDAWDAWREARGGKPLPTDRTGAWFVETRLPPTPTIQRNEGQAA